MAARVQRDHFSGSVLIARDGKVLFSRGYGMANLEQDVPNTPQTKFRLGSITKQFTAMAILILQERGKLNVQDKVKKYLPDAPKAWDEITIHHLLTHTSGIPNYTALPGLPQDAARPGHAQGADRQVQGPAARLQAGREVPLQQLRLRRARADHRDRLGPELRVVPQASRSSDPLEMKDTGYDNATVILKHRASGYTRRLGIILTNCDYVDMSIPHAAGALYSTAAGPAQVGPGALRREAGAPRSRWRRCSRPFKDNYGYGWLIDRKFGLKRYEHGGGIMGFVTIIERFPEEKLLVVALEQPGELSGRPDRQRPGRHRAGPTLCRAARAEGREAGPQATGRVRRPLRGRYSWQGQEVDRGLPGWLPAVRSDLLRKDKIFDHPGM